MGIAERTNHNNGIIFPNEVRQILNSDNDEIKRLCKQVKVYPKKDHLTGKTFFMKDDVEFLKRIKELHDRGQKLLDQGEREFFPPAQMQTEEQTNISNVDGTVLMREFQNALEKMISNQESMAQRIENTLESKLDGMDEVVVELIQIKTENETLRMKLNQLTKENYELRNEVERFRPVALGFYVKQNNSLV